MKILYLLLLHLLVFLTTKAQPNAPDKLYGQLFIDVQLKKVFADGKTFVDCIPKRSVQAILKDYTVQRDTLSNLKLFVENNFYLPEAPPTVTSNQENLPIVEHINNLWSVLSRNPDKKQVGSSLLPLPYPYIVPGGRFREMYYWDSYFTMLGLFESNQFSALENMVKNFAYLLNTYGHIPNGTRTYYLGRSQPPFFSLMVDLLASVKGNQAYKTYLPQLQKEYNYFMRGSSTLKNGQAFRYVVKTSDGFLLNRYWDDMDIPRQESYAEDVATANKACLSLAMRTRWKTNEAKEKSLAAYRKTIYRHIRAAACSGLDFSNKWFADGESMETIHTTDFVTADLNALLLRLEQVLSYAYSLNGNKATAAIYAKKATARTTAMLKYCWNKELNYFTDYDFVAKKKATSITPLGMFPFSFLDTTNVKCKQMANEAAIVLKINLLKDGGLQTTVKSADQQWDAPNGWAPLHWMSIIALNRFNNQTLAKEIATRWINLNKKVYLNTGKLMEKYNVVNTALLGGGGEYPGQDGFGWTNGVFLSLLKQYDLNN